MVLEAIIAARFLVPCGVLDYLRLGVYH